MLDTATAIGGCMKTNWFEPLGWLHRPVSVAGWLISAAALAYMIQVFLALNMHSYSVSDMLYGVYLHWGVTLLGWDWIARRTSAGDTR
jgi:hypothetical protein